jgi:nitrite reductase/ring-hydroxylating ferredoxin subunit
VAKWVSVADVSDITENAIHGIVKHELILVRTGSAIQCFKDVCSHQDVKLSEFGEIIHGVIQCFAHGARFDPKNGAPLCFPAKNSLEQYDVKIEDGKVFVKL